MLKFRSMADGADRHATSLHKHNHHASGPLFKLIDDPRVTRVGKFLRRYSIDEFPQFVNVLKGEMSALDPAPRCAMRSKCMKVLLNADSW